jgi:hypothetical protein
MFINQITLVILAGLESSGSLWERVSGGVSDYAWTVVMPVAGLLYFAWKRYGVNQILRVPYFEGESPAWSSFKALAVCLGYAWKLRQPWQLFVIARALSEYTILHPRPCCDEHDELTLVERKRRIKDWQLMRRRVVRGLFDYDDKHPEAVTEIEVETAFDLYSREKYIEKYFKVLGQMGNRISGRTKSRFVVPVRVKKGYVAPIHLLSGLLAQFGESWTQLIRAYGQDSRMVGATLQGRHQLFTFYCWLQWGPSVPMCSEHCDNWVGATRALQFGFGDENNSFPLLPGEVDKEGEAQRFAELRTKVEGSNVVMPYEVLVYPRWALSCDDKHRGQATSEQNWREHAPKDLATLAGAQRHLTYPEMGSGLVLDYVSHNEASGAVAPYYSAYLWMVFVVCGENGEPVHPMNEKPWLGLIPYFEHANIADAGSRTISMKQLASKVVRSLGDLIKRGQTKVNAQGVDVSGDRPLDQGFIVYGCAFDHTGCPSDKGAGSNASTAELRSKGMTLAGMVEHEIREYSESNPGPWERVVMDAGTWQPPASSTGEAKRRLVQNLRDTQENFAACHLPDVIELLYRAN